MGKEQNKKSENIEVVIALTKKKLIDTAFYKMIYTFISTIFTAFATHYTNEFNIIILSTIIFVTPFFIESLEKINVNIIEKISLIIFRISYIILTSMLFIVLIWSLFNIEDAYYYSKWFIYYIIYISIGLSVIYSLCSYMYIRNDDNLPLALALVKEKSIENKIEMLNYEEDMKEVHKKNHRKFIKEKTSKPNQGGRKK